MFRRGWMDHARENIQQKIAFCGVELQIGEIQSSTDLRKILIFVGINYKILNEEGPTMHILLYEMSRKGWVFF